MKIILSRKGFDSANGGMPSPIMPDGTLLSLPIGNRDESIGYDDLHYDGKSYFEIVKELNPHSKMKKFWKCHLDPDLRKNIKERTAGWQAALGQCGTALCHLNNQGVNCNDLFLFFGWFRQTEKYHNRLRFVPKAFGRHIIFGYLQAGQIFSTRQEVPSTLREHPHYSRDWTKPNAIYVAAEQLSLQPSLPGAGCLKKSHNLVLTKEGHSRTQWDMPDFFKQIEISYHSQNSWKDGYFQSAAIGQEFVFESDQNTSEWAKTLIESGMNE